VAVQRHAREAVHPGAAKLGVAEQKSAGFDDVDGDAQARGRAEHGSSILRDIGLEQGKSHGRGPTL